MSLLSHSELAKYCSEIYTGKADILNPGEADAFFRIDGNELIIACPGTHVDDARAWARDFSAWPGYFGNLGWLHDGFGTGGEILWPEVRQHILLNEGVHTITFTGHSLGGALATVLAACCSLDSNVRFRLVIFGAPRVSTLVSFKLRWLLARSIHAVSYRRDGDPVPHLPLAPLYLHSVHSTKIGKRLHGLDPFANHSIDLYAADVLARETANGPPTS